MTKTSLSTNIIFQKLESLKIYSHKYGIKAAVGRVFKQTAKMALKHSGLSGKFTVFNLKRQGYDCSNFISAGEAFRLGYAELWQNADSFGDSLLFRFALEQYYRKTGKKLLIASGKPEFFVNTVFCYVLKDFITEDRIKENCTKPAVNIGKYTFTNKILNHGFCYRTNSLGEVVRKFPDKHIITTLCEEMGIEGEVVIEPGLNLTAKEKLFGRFSGKKQIAVMNGGVMLYKDLPAETTQKIIDELSDKYDFVQIGSEMDLPLKNALNMQGRLSLREVAAVLYNSDLFIGTIGGLMHLARAVNCRSVIAYSGEPDYFVHYNCNAKSYSVTPCEECPQNRVDPFFEVCPYDYKCIKNICYLDMIEKINDQINHPKEISPHVETAVSKEVNGIEGFLRLTQEVYKRRPRAVNLAER